MSYEKFLFSNFNQIFELSPADKRSVSNGWNKCVMSFLSQIIQRLVYSDSRDIAIALLPESG